ncbi:MAG: polyprenol monophosphomannose synthase [Candidatus Bathyarchaeia archaeon]
MVDLISIVIPTRNEPMVEELVTRIRQILRNQTCDYEILAVDKSDDDTPERLRHLGVRVIEQKDTGLGRAILEGLKAASGDPVIVMDADLSHNPDYIPHLLEKNRKGYDIVVGSRRMRGGGILGWGLYRIAISKIANILGRTLAGLKVSDVTSGYRLYSRRVIDFLKSSKFKSRGYAFQLEVLARASRRGYLIGDVPIIFQNRVGGVSKLSHRDILEYLSTSIQLCIFRGRGPTA